MNTQINNLQNSNILGTGVDNASATIGIQINIETDKTIKRKVKIFALNKIIKLNDEAIIMDSYNPSSPISEGTVNHLGCKIDIDKINIGKLETEKLKMDLKIKLDYFIKNNMGSYILGCIE